MMNGSFTEALQKAVEISQEMGELKAKREKIIKEMRGKIEVIEEKFKPLKNMLYYLYLYRRIQNNNAQLNESYIAISSNDKVEFRYYFHDYPFRAPNNHKGFVIIRKERERIPGEWELEDLKIFVELFPAFVNFLEYIRLLTIENVYETEKTAEVLNSIEV